MNDFWTIERRNFRNSCKTSCSVLIRQAEFIFPSEIYQQVCGTLLVINYFVSREVLGSLFLLVLLAFFCNLLTEQLAKAERSIHFELFQRGKQTVGCFSKTEVFQHRVFVVVL